jgi:hypothetical protein
MTVLFSKLQVLRKGTTVPYKTNDTARKKPLCYYLTLKRNCTYIRMGAPNRKNLRQLNA